MAISTVKATVNGQEVTLTLNSSTGKYEATLTAPTASSNSLAAGYFPVSITATDTAGNSTTIDHTHGTFGNSLKLYTTEKVNPTISVTAPGAGSYSTSATPSLSFTASDKGTQTTGFSGFDTSAAWLSITLDGTAKSGAGLSDILSGISSTPASANAAGYYGEVAYSAAFKSLSDGQHTAVITVTDKDGNTASVTRTFTVDTVRPELTGVAVNSDTGSSIETNTKALTITGTASDVTGGTPTVTITVDGTDQGTVTVGNGGAFSKAITVSTDGTYTIVVTATDAAGNSTSVTKTVTVDTSAPVFTSVTISAQSGDAGRTYTISVSVS